MTYRGDGDGWLLKREALVDALRAESDLDVREKIALELAVLDRGRRIEARRRLPLVAGAAIASPCHETFEAMVGDGAIRSCARCDQEVFDLAQMTLGQAEALIVSRSGASTCVRLRKRPDGTMMFADCEVGARGVRTRRVGLAVAAAVIASTAVALLVSPPVHLHVLPSTHHTHRSIAPGSGVRYLHDERPRAEPPIQVMGAISSLSVSGSHMTGS